MLICSLGSRGGSSAQHYPGQREGRQSASSSPGRGGSYAQVEPADGDALPTTDSARTAQKPRGWAIPAGKEL